MDEHGIYFGSTATLYRWNWPTAASFRN
jgi:hypothetical protein